MNNREGTFKECLKHFAQSRNEILSAHRCAVRNRVSEILKTHSRPLLTWLEGTTFPNGLNLIRIQYFLELVGYSVLERNALTDPQRNLANYIGSFAISVEEVMNRLQTMDANTILRWATGRSNPSSQKERLMMSMFEEYREAHKTNEEKMKAEFQHLGLSFSVIPIPNQILKEKEVCRTPVRIANNSSSGVSHKTVIDTLAHLILAAKPLAELVLTDEYSPEEREILRQLTQVVRSNGVFDLSNTLNRLCSERARRENN